MWRLQRWWPWAGRKPIEETLVKVAGFRSEAEAQGWVETLRQQGIGAEVRGPTDNGQPRQLLGREWELWVSPEDERQARLILGLTGRSVIRVPRQRTVRK